MSLTATANQNSRVPRYYKYASISITREYGYDDEWPYYKLKGMQMSPSQLNETALFTHQ